MRTFCSLFFLSGEKEESALNQSKREIDVCGAEQGQQDHHQNVVRLVFIDEHGRIRRERAAEESGEKQSCIRVFFFFAALRHPLFPFFDEKEGIEIDGGEIDTEQNV